MRATFTFLWERRTIFAIWNGISSIIERGRLWKSALSPFRNLIRFSFARSHGYCLATLSVRCLYIIHQEFVFVKTYLRIWRYLSAMQLYHKLALYFSRTLPRSLLIPTFAVLTLFLFVSSPHLNSYNHTTSPREASHDNLFMSITLSPVRETRDHTKRGESSHPHC